MNNFVVPANAYESHNAYRRLQMNLSLNDPKTAVIEIRTFLKIYPDVAQACNDLGVLYYREGEKLLALACYEKANRLQPGTPDIVKNLADFYCIELGWTDDAIRMLTELLCAHPEDRDLVIKLALLNEKAGRHQEACSFYSEALELNPSDYAVREALERLGGNTIENQCEVSVPEPEPNSHVKIISPEPASDPEYLEDVLANLKASISSALGSQPESPAPVASVEELYAEARKYIGAGDPSQAIETLEKLLALDPVNALAHNDLGVLFTNSGDMEQACIHQEAAVRYCPSNAGFRKNLAALYYSCQGKTDEAIAIYTQLLREQPTDVETLTALAIISEANNLREEARTFIGRVLSLEPWNKDARNFLEGL